MDKKIYTPRIGYSAFLLLTNFATRCHYNSVTLRGYENLPQGESYILAPCHQQALMDPLVLLTKDNKPVVFLARADVFAKPFVRKILTWLRMMPIYRIRDGKESLGKNAEIFDNCREVLLHRMPLCLMAEGRHNNKHQLLPLVKGMFRIAGETQKAMGDKPLYIVPAGLDYDQYEQTYSNAIIHIGQPIDVRPFMEDFTHDEPVALNKMRDTLGSALKAQMHHIESKEHYDAFERISRIALHPMRKAQHLRNTAWDRFETRRQITAKLDAMEQEAQTHEEGIQQLEQMLALENEYRGICQKRGITIDLATNQSHFWEWLLMLIGATAIVVGCVLEPWVLWGVIFAIICFPLTLVPTHLIAKKRIKDPQFRSTANYGIRYGFSLVYSLILLITVLCCHGFLWMLATLAMIFVMGRLSGWITHATRAALQYEWLNIISCFHAKDMRRLKEIENELAKRLNRTN